MTYHVIYTLSFELIIDTILLDKNLKDIWIYTRIINMIGENKANHF